MKPLLLLLFTFFILAFAKAQGPTITAASEAVAGDVFAYPFIQVSGIAVPAAGANITWDYSGAVDSGGIEVDSFKSPSATPYAAMFPGSNLVSYSGGAYLYFNTSSSNWDRVGLIAPGSDTTYYASTINEFHFPFAYGSTYSDSTQAIMHLTGVKDTFELVAASTAVGYGTLKVPGQTFTNVLQVKRLNTTRFKFGGLVYTSINSTIFFVTPAHRSFLMEMDLSPQGQLTEAKYLYNGVIVLPTSYTFTGSGDWSNSANWSNGALPASPVPSGTQVTITPQPGGSCTLNVPMVFAAGATLTVSPGALFNVDGKLTINK